MKPVPKILHVVVSLAHGGLEKLVVNWTNARNKRFPKSTAICCLDRPGELADEVLGGAVLCINADRSRFPMDLAAVRRIRSCMLGLPGSIVHSHNLAAQQYSAAAVLGTSGKHIHTEHGTNPHFGGLKNSLRAWLMVKMTDRIVAVSEDTATELGRNQKISRSKLLVVRNGVSPRKERHFRQPDELRTDLGIDDQALVVGSIGRLAHVKGYDRLLEAIAKLCRELGLPAGGSSPSTTVLLLVGDGPEREALIDQAKTLGIEEKVIFTGYRRDAVELLDLMDLFVLPSRSEGLSIALLEAMLAGVPVLATDVGENGHVLNGGCGVLLPADEANWPEIIEDQLSLIISQSPAIAGRVESAKKRVFTDYSEDATLDAYENEYRRLLSHGVLTPNTVGTKS